MRDRGIFLDDDSYLHLPLRICLPNEGQLNFIPVDYFVTATLSVIEDSSSGRVYHIANDLSVTMDTLVEYAERFLKIKGLKLVYGREEMGAARNMSEDLFERSIKSYRPYMSDKRIFQRKNIELVAVENEPPPFSYPIFERCMEYAISVEWGKMLFAEERKVELVNSTAD